MRHVMRSRKPYVSRFTPHVSRDAIIPASPHFGNSAVAFFVAVVYRTLRNMEQAGLVVSAWEMEGSGPPRRVYSITLLGDEYLACWAKDLRETDRVLHAFLAAYDTLELEIRV